MTRTHVLAFAAAAAATFAAVALVAWQRNRRRLKAAQTPKRRLP